MSADDIRTIALGDTEYPSLLAHINDPPQQLYIRGNPQALHAPHLLGVVGSRKATVYGKQALGILLPQVIRSDVTIVSGLAFGIDALAHKQAVQEKMPTVAVLGSGIDDKTLYPQAHKKLAREILEHGGAIVSEYPPGTPGKPFRFPERNRIVAGLCRAILVAQAATKSGSLITARLALEYNREVLAIPGNITEQVAQGTNLLIQQGATPVLKPQDILDVLQIETGSPTKETVRTALTTDQELVFTHLSTSPQHIDDITNRIARPAQQTASLLLELELLNHAEHVGGMKYVRK